MGAAWENGQVLALKKDITPCPKIPPKSKTTVDIVTEAGVWVKIIDSHEENLFNLQMKIHNLIWAVRHYTQYYIKDGAVEKNPLIYFHFSKMQTVPEVVKTLISNYGLFSSFQ